MGVQIAEILPKKQTSIEELRGKTFAVDSLLWIHQFLSIIRGPDGTPLKDSKGRITSHLSGILYRNAKLLESGLKLIWVFDGKPPEFKARTTAARAEIKATAHREWKEALEKGDIEKAHSAAMRTSSVNEEILSSAKELILAMGIPVLQAPSEGEAQCSALCSAGIVWSVASQDSDSLLFGTPRLVRNLSISGKRKLPGKQVFVDVNPELIELKEALSILGLTRSQLIILGLLVGTDYNPGVRGIGPRKALKLVREEKTLENVLKKIQWDGSPAEELLSFFLNPPALENPKIETPNLNPEKIMKIMVDEHEFSQERIEKVVRALEEMQKPKGLNAFKKS